MGMDPSVIQIKMSMQILQLENLLKFSCRRV